MIRRPPRATRTDTLFPYTTLFRSPLTKGGLSDLSQGAGEPIALTSSVCRSHWEIDNAIAVRRSSPRKQGVHGSIEPTHRFDPASCVGRHRNRLHTANRDEGKNGQGGDRNDKPSNHDIPLWCSSHEAARIR